MSIYSVGDVFLQEFVRGHESVGWTQGPVVVRVLSLNVEITIGSNGHSSFGGPYQLGMVVEVCLGASIPLESGLNPNTQVILNNGDITEGARFEGDQLRNACVNNMLYRCALVKDFLESDSTHVATTGISPKYLLGQFVEVVSIQSVNGVDVSDDGELAMVLACSNVVVGNERKFLIRTEVARQCLISPAMFWLDFGSEILSSARRSSLNRDAKICSADWDHIGNDDSRSWAVSELAEYVNSHLCGKHSIPAGVCSSMEKTVVDEYGHPSMWDFGRMTKELCPGAIEMPTKKPRLRDTGLSAMGNHGPHPTSCKVNQLVSTPLNCTSGESVFDRVASGPFTSHQTPGGILRVNEFWNQSGPAKEVKSQLNLYNPTQEVRNQSQNVGLWQRPSSDGKASTWRAASDDLRVNGVFRVEFERCMYVVSNVTCVIILACNFGRCNLALFFPYGAAFPKPLALNHAQPDWKKLADGSCDRLIVSMDDLVCVLRVVTKLATVWYRTEVQVAFKLILEHALEAQMEVRVELYVTLLLKYYQHIQRTLVESIEESGVEDLADRARKMLASDASDFCRIVSNPFNYHCNAMALKKSSHSQSGVKGVDKANAYGGGSATKQKDRKMCWKSMKGQVCTNSACSFKHTDSIQNV